MPWSFEPALAEPSLGRSAQAHSLARPHRTLSRADAHSYSGIPCQVVTPYEALQTAAADEADIFYAKVRVRSDPPMGP